MGTGDLFTIHSGLHVRVQGMHAFASPFRMKLINYIQLKKCVH